MTVTCVLWIGLLSPVQELGDPLPPPVAGVTQAELRHHVAWLASDELRGREAGSPAAHRAARYLAKALEAAGLEGAGLESGGLESGAVLPAGETEVVAEAFLQAVPLQRFEHRAAPRLTVTGPDGAASELAFGVDFDLFVRGAPDAPRRLPLRSVHAAQELPRSAASQEALFLNGNSRERKAWLASGDLDPELSDWGLCVRTGSKRAGKPGRMPQSRLERALAAGSDDPCDIVRLRGPWCERLLTGEIESLELILDTRREELVDYNVVGLLRGVGSRERPELAAQAVVFSAHYDHLGVADADAKDARGDEGEPDRIFNGADDDASGVAAVLELAQAFADGEAPARTLVFLLAGGEEKGLLGTRAYLEAPAVGLSDTVANLNFEMIGRPDESVGGPGHAWLTGFERTNLGERFAAAGLAIHPDQRPEQNFFQRSDNYAFALRGIVAQTLSSYDLHQDYHRVTDETHTLDFEHLSAVVEQALRASRLLASGELDPRWLPGGRPAQR